MRTALPRESANRPSGAGPGRSELECRILDASLRLVARWGFRKTTVSDIAKEVGCGRATVYRAFPGGRSEVFQAAAELERDRLFVKIGKQIDQAGSREAALVAATVTASRLAHSNGALEFVLAHEPESVLVLFGFDRINWLYRAVVDAFAPHFEPYFGDGAPEATELLTRLVLSYLFNPSPSIDPRREDDARRLVRDFVLPALESTHPDRPNPSQSTPPKGAHHAVHA